MLSRRPVSRILQLNSISSTVTSPQLGRSQQTIWTVTGLTAREHKSLREIHDAADLKQEPIRRPSWAFDPLNTAPDQSLPGGFRFIQLTTERKYLSVHANFVDPAKFRVPWPSQFPGSLQSKYWPVLEQCVREYASGFLAGKTWQDDKPEKLELIVDAVVTFIVNVFPTGHLDRMKHVAKLYVLIFTHDGMLAGTLFDVPV